MAILTGESVWLGRARQPVKWLAIAFAAVVGALWLFFVIRLLLGAGDAVAMHELIRPAGRPLVWTMLAAMLGVLIFASVWLSDFKGDIEPERAGFFDILSLILSRAAMILIGLIVLVMFYEVISRYIFARPTLWANELSLWIAAFVFLLSGQYAMQQRSHIRIYVIYDVMPRWMQKTADVISVGLITGFFVALVWGGYNDALRRMLRMETFGTAWDPPIPGTVKPAILIIIGLVTLQAISNLIADWNKAPEHHSADDIDEVEIENMRRALGTDEAAEGLHDAHVDGTRRQGQD